MQKIVLTLGAMILSIVSVIANTDDYRIMWHDDPATSMVVGWNQIDGNNPVVYFDIVDHGTNVAAYAFNNGVDRNVTAYGLNNNFSRLTNLSPNTIYYFVIQDDNSVSQRFWFKTMPDQQTERLSFLAGGDSRNNREQRQNANKLVASLRPHAVLFGGDYTSSGTDTQWQEWFEDWQLTIGADGRMIPIVATRGNHESTNSEVVDLFDVPSADVYYKTVFAGGLVSAYTLNTEITIGGTQASWLATELANDNSVYKMAQYHKPVRSHVGSKAEGTNQYTHWVPLFDQYSMDLVVECDSHTAKSTWPILASTGAGADEGFIRDDLNGVVYVGEGCWGAPLRAADDSKSWTRDSGMFNQIKWIFIDLNQIEVRSIKTDNACNVGVVSDSDIFSAPANLDINSPANGAVIIIPNEVQTCGALRLNEYQQCSINAVPEIPNNLSGICYNDNSKTLFGISDLGEIYELDLDGNYIRTITLTGFSDTEAICYLGNDQFVVTEEGLGRLVFLTIPNSINNTTIAYPGSSEYIQLNGTWGNQGLEGVTYNFHDDILYFSKENNNMEIFKLDNPLSNKGTSLTPSLAFDISMTSYPGNPSFSNLNGLSYTFQGSLMMLSREGDSLVEVDPNTGTLISNKDISTAGLNYPQGIIAVGSDKYYVVGHPNQICTYEKDCRIRSASIASSFADVEERQNGDIYENSSDIELINDGTNNGDQTIGLEFINLGIPAGSNITSARIQFTSDNTNSNVDPINLTIKADATANPPSIEDVVNNLTSRVLTASTVSWSPPLWTNTLTAGPNQLTPELKTVLQEVVDQSGINGLNSVLFVISGTGRRTAASFDQSPDYGAKLIVSYEDNCTDSDHDGICDSIDNCPSLTNHDQLDINSNGIGDACENLGVANCAREANINDNINRWVGPLVGNWYDDECYWSKGSFPTECDDVVIDLNQASVTLRNGASAFGYTLKVDAAVNFHTEMGSSLCVEVF